MATSQGGVLADWQLIPLGVGRRTIESWLRRGRLHRKFRGVYALGHEAITAKGRIMGPLLACGPGAVLSHRSAADWWEIAATSRVPVDVTVTGRSRAGQPGLDLHQVRSLDPRDVSEHEGVPITTVARTLLDYAEVVPPRRLKAAVEEADRRHLFDGNAVHELLARSPGRRGLKPLRLLLADFAYAELSRSEFEALFFDTCKNHGLPRPVINAIVHGFEVDAHWPGTNLIVELDSRQFHLNPKAFEADRERDVLLTLAGYCVVRVTWRQLTREPAKVADRLSRLLADPQPAPPSPRSAARRPAPAPRP